MALDARGVTSLKAQFESRYSSQRFLDEKMLALYIQRHSIEGREPPADLPFRPLGTGFVGLMVDQDVAILGGDFSIRVSPSAASGQTGEREASGVLEPFINTSFRTMQKYAEVWRPLVKDSRIYGRAFAIGPLPAPFFWGMNDELSQLYTRLETGDKEKARADIKAYYEGNFPIAWSHWNAKDVYCTYTPKHQPNQVIYTRKMYAGQIVDEWGEDALPDRKRSVGPLTLGKKGYSDSERPDVVHYVDKEVYSVVVPDRTDPRMAYSWEHRMNCTPVTFAETNRLPENEHGWVWAGAHFHIRESIHALDDAYTEWRTSIRQDPRSPLVATVNAEQRGLIGWPNEIKMPSVPGEVINLLTDEKLDRAPIPQMNPEIAGFIDRMTNIVGLLGVRRDALMGAGPSGQSAVHLNVAQTLEKGELAEAKNGLERALVSATKLLLRSVQALAEEYPDAPDTITAAPAGKKADAISVTAEDVRGQEDRVSATIDLNLPVNEGLMVQAYAMAVQSKGLDPYSARERFLRVENPADIDDKWLEYDAFQIAGDVVKSVIAARTAGGLQAIGQNPALLKKIGSLSEFAIMGLTRAFGAGAQGATPVTPPQVGPSPGRSLANLPGAVQNPTQQPQQGLTLP